MTESRHVFTYGSLMFPVVWEAVVRDQYRSAPAAVRGFKRLKVHGEQYPGLVIAQNAGALTGKVYFDVSRADIARLDHFETSDYARIAIATRAEGKIFAAQTYISLNPAKLERIEWSPTEFEQHGLALFLDTYATTNSPPSTP